MNIDWFLGHVRDPDPAQGSHPVGRELRNAAGVVDSRATGREPAGIHAGVDAEVVDRNVIRLDTDNVIDMVLTPSARAHRCLESPCAWFGMGARRELRVTRRRPAAQAGWLQGRRRVHKSPKLPGATADFVEHAVCRGHRYPSSRDAAMREVVAAKAKGFRRRLA